MDYHSFIKSKEMAIAPSGFEIDESELNAMMLDFQRAIVSLALRVGRFCIWADCGLGKGFMALEWAHQVCRHTGGNVLILAPLAVARQFASEAKKFGVSVTVCKENDDVRPGVNVANYERLEKFDCSRFEGVVLDESSILKAYTGSYRNLIIESFAATPYKLACSATPAPNDYMELGNHAEFMGVMSRTEMLAMFFTHDGGNTSQWRIKGHAEDKFWQWVCTWAVLLKSPADLGFDGSRYQLPSLNMHEITVGTAIAPPEGQLLWVNANTLSDQRHIRKASLQDRCAIAAEIVASRPNEQWIVWCDLNDESSLLAKLIQDAIEVKGSDSDRLKVDAVASFLEYSCQLNLKKNPKEKKNTCVNGSKTIEQESRNTGQRQKKSAMPEEGSFMRGINTEETKLSSSQLNGEKQILTNICQVDSKSLGSQHPTITQCLKAKMEDARSASELTPSTNTQEYPIQSDCTLTTATNQEKSEDCSALPATLASGNSLTTLSYSEKQHHTLKGRVLISKPSIFGFGLNLQNCNNVIFVGLSHSFEAFYQAIRRNWRFGQENEVNCWVVTHQLEGAIVSNIKRKESDAESMQREMVKHMQSISMSLLNPTASQKTEYLPTQLMSLPIWLEGAIAS